MAFARVTYADLPNHRAYKSLPATFPSTIIGATAKRDFIGIDGMHATLLELTVPWDNLSSIKNARAQKQGKVNYQHLGSVLYFPKATKYNC